MSIPHCLQWGYTKQDQKPRSCACLLGKHTPQLAAGFLILINEV